MKQSMTGVVLGLLLFGVTTVRAGNAASDAVSDSKVTAKGAEDKVSAKKSVDEAVACDVAECLKKLGAPSYRERKLATLRLLAIAKTRPHVKGGQFSDEKRAVGHSVSVKTQAALKDGKVIMTQKREVKSQVAYTGEPTGDFLQDESVKTVKDIAKAWKRQFPYIDLVIDQAKAFSSSDDPEVAFRARTVLNDCLDLKTRFEAAHRIPSETW